MARFANYYDGVSALLDKIADALDPDRANVKSSNYSTSVIDSLERIADNFDPSAWGGFPEVFAYSGYIVKKAGVSGTANRYTKAEFKKLLEDNGVVFLRYSISSGNYALYLFWLVDTTTVEVVALPCFNYGCYIASTGFSVAGSGYVSTPEFLEYISSTIGLPPAPSEEGEYVLKCTVSEYGEAEYNWEASGGGGEDFGF